MTIDEDLTPRDYQIELYEKAVKGNVILYLPTGAGKTFIAIMLIKHMSADVRKTWHEGKKLIIFLVNTVPLVTQQCDCISRQTDLKCSSYSGDMNVDFWNKDRWDEEFKENQVLIMTSQILLDLLTKSFLSLSRINLIVFDECHHAVKDHPMRQIMKSFEVYDKAKHPKILGLSATLLNCNVKSDQATIPVKNLEITFNARVVSIDSISVQTKYGKPIEATTKYNPPVDSIIFPKLLEIINDNYKLLNIIDINSDYFNESSPEFQSQKKSVKLKNTLDDIKCHISELGLYVGNIGIVHHMIQIERFKLNYNLEARAIFDYIKTSLIRMQKMIYQQMNEPTEMGNILKYSSDKILKLFNILLKTYSAMTKKNEKFCCIIFVTKRFTAKLLYHLLKKLNELNQDFKFLIPDYVIGNNCDPFKKPIENMCLKKWNSDGLFRFRTGVSNCLIATQVLEEGVDIPQCNLVINFDSSKDFRSYVQSRGRARDENSSFITFVENGDKQFFTRNNEFKKVEKVLKSHIVENPVERIDPLPEEIKMSLYNYNIEPYIVTDKNGRISQLTEVSVIPSLNLYCMKLKQSKFSCMQPTYKLHKITNKNGGEESQFFKVSIHLPLISPFRDIIYGNLMPSIVLAKRSAAMKVCKKLHEIGEFTDNLVPREMHDMIEDITLSLKYWKEELPENKKKVGETFNKRFYDVIHPKVFQNAFPLPNKDIYLHIIDAKPIYPQPIENRDRVLYNLLKSPSGFGILSSKKIPKLPQFPIYMKMGQINITLQTNLKCIKLSSEEIQELQHFHWLIFNDILSLIKAFMIFDSLNRENNFLIVPTNENGELNWPVIRNYKSLEKIFPKKIPQKAITNGIDDEMPENYSDWELVSPNYRSATNIYVVTQVCYNLNPQSTFPTDDYICYSHYFAEKHKLPISDTTQPLFEVKPISNKINFIKKRTPVSPNKRKRENLEEHLIPELCCKINFPALYYLKAQTLPSILHRVNQLLIAEELRQQIATEAGLGSASALKDKDCMETLHFSGEEIPSDEETSSEHADDTDEYGTQIEDIFDDVDEHDNVKDDIKIESDISILSFNKNAYPWAKVKEPHDLERDILNIQLMDIEYYNNFQNSLYSLDVESSGSKNPKEFYKREPIVKIPSLTITNITTGNAPSAADLLPALISKRANDSINLERLETLGDAFLKFVISLYLFEQYPYQPEGRLTGCKGKIIGNRHLYYCGVNKQIPGRLKIEEFVPKSNFIVPTYSTPQEIQQMIRIQNKAANVLYEVTIPPLQQFQGLISDEVRNEFFHKISTWINADPTVVDPFIDIQNIADKTIADAVEAIIGVYLENMNLLGAGKLLQWFGIISDQVDIQQILFGSPKSAVFNIGDVDIHMPWANHIQDILGYKFKDRSFLLQAFTHASYSRNNITFSYDRLEFLGDAIIDFLITVYIYENFNNLNPGELTDLRSALVNNITFACLAVKYKLNTALLAYTPTLFESIDRFVKFQEERNYAIDDELLWILLEEDDCDAVEYIDVPKVLGDLFESVIGAIYLDSGKDLNKTWSILYSLMHNEINKFSKNVPKQAIRVLYETPGINPHFLKFEVNESTKKMLVTLRIRVLGKYKYFHGFGSTKKLAKIGAAKRALKFLQQCN